MKTVKDRADARWLPSRFRYAIFRLLAYRMIRRRKPQATPGLVLVIDRDQSALEYYTITVWLMATVSCYIGAVLSRFTNVTIAALVAVPLASFVLTIPVYVTGLVMPLARAAGIRQEQSLRVGSTVVFFLLTICAAYFALEQSWVRYVALSFFAILLVNGIAAVVVWSLRGRFVELDDQFGVAA